MAKSMYNFGKHAREKAKQQKQMEKAEKRMMAKQQKANMKTDAPTQTQIQPSRNRQKKSLKA